MITDNSKFADEIIEHLNKDEESIQRDAVYDTITDYIIQCKMQISLLETSSIPQLNLQLEKAKRKLKNTENKLDKTYLILKDNFEDYIKSIMKVKSDIESTKDEIKSIKQSIKQTNTQMKNYRDLLEKISK